jgi:hypothetical protein
MRSIGRVGMYDAALTATHDPRLPHPDRFAVCPSP